MKLFAGVPLLMVILLFILFDGLAGDKVVYTPSVKAILFGFMAVSAVFVGLLPEHDHSIRCLNKFEALIVPIDGAVASSLSSWFALEGLAGDLSPFAYLAPLIACYIFIAFVILATFVNRPRNRRRE